MHAKKTCAGSATAVRAIQIQPDRVIAQRDRVLDAREAERGRRCVDEAVDRLVEVLRPERRPHRGDLRGLAHRRREAEQEEQRAGVARDLRAHVEAGPRRRAQLGVVGHALAEAAQREDEEHERQRLTAAIAEVDDRKNQERRHERRSDPAYPRQHARSLARGVDPPTAPGPTNRSGAPRRSAPPSCEPARWCRTAGRADRLSRRADCSGVRPAGLSTGGRFR